MCAGISAGVLVWSWRHHASTAVTVFASQYSYSFDFHAYSSALISLQIFVRGFFVLIWHFHLCLLCYKFFHPLHESLSYLFVAILHLLHCTKSILLTLSWTECFYHAYPAPKNRTHDDLSRSFLSCCQLFLIWHFIFLSVNFLLCYLSIVLNYMIKLT